LVFVVLFLTAQAHTSTITNTEIIKPTQTKPNQTKLITPAKMNHYIYKGGEIPEGVITLIYDESYGFELCEYLPDSIQYLVLGTTNLTELPQKLPSNLKELDCCNNFLRTLPELPETLQILECYNNRLSNLPKLPNSLVSLECQDNELDELPELPESLITLICYNNKLSELPKLSHILQFLLCNNNNIKYLSAHNVEIIKNIFVNNYGVNILYNPISQDFSNMEDFMLNL